MDESAYRKVLSATTSNACPFEKSILTRCVDCSRADKHNIAEREIVTCNQAEFRQRCVELQNSLRHNFNFSLGMKHIDGPLPHAKEMRLQCGGLKGLQRALDGNNDVCDVSELVGLARDKYGVWENFPFSEIVQLANTYFKSR